MKTVYAFVVVALLASGLLAQEKKPAFVRGDQLVPAKSAPAPPPETPLGEDAPWLGKTFWFSPNLKMHRSLRLGFAASLSAEDLEPKALLFPAEAVEFKVIALEKGYVPYKGDNSIKSYISFYKVQFTDGSFGYLKKRESYSVCSTTMGDIKKALDSGRTIDMSSFEVLAKPVEYSSETFFLEDPAAMLKKYQTERDAANAKIAAKRKADAAAWQARGGAKIGMTKAQALASNWGKPSKINTTIKAGLTHEQWVYGTGSYLYFENGILTTIQN